MKLLVVFAVFAVIACASAAVLSDATYEGPTYELRPIEDGDGDSDVGVDGQNDMDLPPIRARRVTCDLFSWQSKWFSMNHAACAAKCLIQGRRGGSCRDGVCICR